jgi:hypothetical protein
MASKKTLKVANAKELASYIINSINAVPGVGHIDLPTRDMSLKQIGDLILDTPAHRNAYYDVLNRLALINMTRSYYEFPYGFMLRGSFTYGDSVEEVDVDAVDPLDYYDMLSQPEEVLTNYVPNVKSYIHSINLAKVYAVTVDYNQAAEAFLSEDGLFTLVDKLSETQYNSAKFDLYFLVKYMVQRRILSGTVAPIYVDGFDSMTATEQVAEIKAIVNTLIEPSRKYNPAGILKAVSPSDMTLILDAHGEANYSTLNLALAFNKSEAEFRTSYTMISDWTTNDFTRLAKLIPNVQEFTEAEKAVLASIRGFCSTAEWWQIYDKEIVFDGIPGDENATAATNMTTFSNPLTLRKTQFLHVQRIMSTSPFQPAFFITTTQPAISSVTVSPDALTLAASAAKMSVQLTTTVVAVGGANKAVTYAIDATAAAAGVTVDVNGLISIPANYTGDITVTVSSIFDPTATDEATITVR